MVGKVAILRPWRSVLREVTAALRGSGLDLLAPLSVEWYNSAVPPALHLPTMGRRSAPLAILVGNSKAIWDPFISSLRSQPSLLDSPHPLQTFVKQSLTSALRQSSFHVIDAQVDEESATTEALMNSNPDDSRAVIFWDHDTRPGKLVAMQRLAYSAGLASFGGSSNLCVHPAFGPWFALRAVVIFDLDPPTDEERPMAPIFRPTTTSAGDGCLLSKQNTRKQVTGDQKPRAEEQQQPQERHWRDWLAVRDAIVSNHPMRYGPDQIEYHYTHNKEILARLL